MVACRLSYFLASNSRLIGLNHKINVHDVNNKTILYEIILINLEAMVVISENFVLIKLIMIPKKLEFEVNSEILGSINI